MTTPGQATVCECGAVTLRWIERPFPNLSNWEPCPLHLAAKDLLAACKDSLRTFEEMDAAYDTSDGDELPDIKRLREVIAKAEGAP